jgi:hypothetical protein
MNNRMHWTSVNSMGYTSVAAGGAVDVYSAAGNVRTDTAHSYLYDQENRLCAVRDNTLTMITKYLQDLDRVNGADDRSNHSTAYYVIMAR